MTVYLAMIVIMQIFFTFLLIYFSNLQILIGFCIFEMTMNII